MTQREVSMCGSSVIDCVGWNGWVGLPSPLICVCVHVCLCFVYLKHDYAHMRMLICTCVFVCMYVCVCVCLFACQKQASYLVLIGERV